MKDIHDLIKHAKFGDDRLRGSRVVAGQISAFPIDFAGRPYNTLTLPCERVIWPWVGPPLVEIWMTSHYRWLYGAMCSDVSVVNWLTPLLRRIGCVVSYDDGGRRD